MLKKKSSKKIDTGEGEKYHCLNYDATDYYSTLRLVFVNVAKSLDYSPSPKFGSFVIIAQLISLFEHKHNKLMRGLIEKIKMGYVPTDDDLAQDSGVGYLLDCVIDNCTKPTLVTARDLMVHNGLIKMWSVKNGNENMPNKVVFNNVLCQKYLDLFDFAPEKFDKWTMNKTKIEHIFGEGSQIFDYPVVKQFTTGSKPFAYGSKIFDYPVVKQLPTGRQIFAPEVLELLNNNKKNNSVNNTPEKKTNLNVNSKTNSDEYKANAIVNLVNYNNQSEFATELAFHMMKNVEMLKGTIAGFDMMKIAQYAEKHATIVFKPSMSGLRNKTSYDCHVSSMGQMNVFREVNEAVTIAPKRIQARGEGQLSYDMKTGVLEDSVRKNIESWKMNQDAELDMSDLEGF